MAELGKELLFVHNRVDGALGDDSALVHFLHGEELLLFLLFNLPDLAKAAPANHVVEHEVTLVNGYSKIFRIER